MKPTKRNKLTIASLLLSTCFLLVPGAHAQDKAIAAKDVEWGYLNPAHGDKSPCAAGLWGDTHLLYGSFVKLPQGFEGEIVAKSNEFKAVVS